jgi:hypothetical protein
MTQLVIILLLFVGWIALAIWIGKFVYWHSEKRWTQIAAVILVLWLPLWDVIPGLYFYNKAVRELGGVQIHKTVEADGFLDLDATDNPYQLMTLRTLPYRYIELRMTRRPYGSPSQTTLTDVPGFYQFSFDPLGDSRCADLEPHFDKRDVQKDLPAGQCLVATRRDVPISRYERESSRGWQATDRYGSYPFVQLSWHEIRDREQNAVIARAVRVRYATWLGARIGAPSVFRLDSTSGGKPIRVRVTEVIKSVAQQSKESGRAGTIQRAEILGAEYVDVVSGKGHLDRAELYGQHQWHR